jgi:DNA-binding beta-propeller fold protein YncE
MLGELPMASSLIVSPDGSIALALGRDTPLEPLPVIDLVSRTIVGQIPIPGTSNPGAFDAAFTPDSRHAVITCGAGIAFADVTERKITGLLQPYAQLFSVAVVREGTLALAGIMDTRNMSTVLVIDMVTRAILRRITLPVPDMSMPVSIWPTPDGRRAWVACSNCAGFWLSFLDLTQPAIAAEPQVVRYPSGTNDAYLQIAFTPDGTRAFVTNYWTGGGVGGPGNVLVLDGATGALVDRFVMDNRHAAITSGPQRFLVASESGISELRLAPRGVKPWLPLATWSLVILPGPAAIAAGPGTRAYVI